MVVCNIIWEDHGHCLIHSACIIVFCCMSKDKFIVAKMTSKLSMRVSIAEFCSLDFSRFDKVGVCLCGQVQQHQSVLV